MNDRLIDSIDEELIKKIRNKYGSPVYIFDKVSFVNNFINLQDEFRKLYPKYRVAYSYKTNYTPYIGRLVKNLGGVAEVVSDFELFAALKNGNDYENIIYNGPLKQGMLEDYVINGGLVNIDNMQECFRLIEIAKENIDKNIRVGIRVNIDIGQDFISRFGLDPDTEEFDTVVKLLKKQENIQLCGIHCHVGQSRSRYNWEQRVKKMLMLSDRLFPDAPPKFIDLGSGMFGDMELQFKEQFGEDVPTYSDYAQIVAGSFAEHFNKFPENERPVLYTEPGATVASRYQWLLTTITSHKCVRGRLVTGVDSSYFNAGETSRYKKLPIRVISSVEDFELGDIVGYTCLEDDCLYPASSKKAAIGDIVLLGNTGGYSIVFKPPFILPDAPMVVLNEDYSYDIIKNKQSYEDMLSLYI